MMIVKGIAFLLGMVSLFILPSIQSIIPLAGLALVGLIFLVNYRRFCCSQSNAFRQKLFEISGVFLWAVIWACGHSYLWSSYSSQLVTEPKKAWVEGYICSIPTSQNYATKFDFCIQKIDGLAVPFAQKSRFKFSWGKYVEKPAIELKAGQYWQFYAKLRPSHGRYNLGGFDYQKWLLAEGYAGQGYIKKQASPITHGTFAISSFYQASRQKLYDRIELNLPYSPYKGLLLGLLLGERGDIDTSQWKVLQASGTGHLFAISGLHIGLAAFWCYWFVFFLWRLNSRLCVFYPASKVAQLGALLGGLSMLLISGMGLPAQRAFIMLAIFILSRWSGRYYELSSVLGMTLIIILLIHPFAVLSTSFWLSFLAVFIISLCLKKQAYHIQVEDSRLGKINKLQKKYSSFIIWLKLNSYLYIVMLAISAYFFNQISVVGLIANLVLIPLVSFILMPILYLSLLCLPLQFGISALILKLATSVISFGYAVQEWLATFNQSLMLFELNNELLLGFCLLSILILLPKKLVSRTVYLPTIIIVLMGVTQTKETEKFSMTVFDIGQGLSIFIETPQGNLLYDTGWGNQDYALAESVVLPFLDKQGINKIDKLVISHADSDHAGGVKQIIEAKQVSEMIWGERLDGYQGESCHGYQPWAWGEISFQFLPHLTESQLEGNNASCVLSVSTPQGKILMTGDIEKQAERALVDKGIKQHQILIAPHHGSKTSSTREFIQQVSPKETIFSAGYDNRWKFPRQSIVERYHLAESRTWVTYRDGAILIRLSNDTAQQGHQELEVLSLRKEERHFWLKPVTVLE